MTINNSTATMDVKNIENKKSMNLLAIWPLDKIFASKSIVSVLPLSGVIGGAGMGRSSGMTFMNMRKKIEEAFEVNKTQAVCLLIDSPGGSPVQSEMIASYIMHLSEEKEIPVFSFVQDIAASGGYWLACAGSEIYASKSSIVGSIGVISASFGFTEAIAKMGIERRVVSQGKNKSVLDPFKPTQKKDIETLNKLQKRVHLHFIDHVKTSRAGKLSQDDDILFNGDFWSGEIAEDYGLIDGIGNLYQVMQEKFGNDVKFEFITTKESWLKKKLGLSVNTEKISQNIAHAMVEETFAQIDSQSETKKYKFW